MNSLIYIKLYKTLKSDKNCNVFFIIWKFGSVYDTDAHNQEKT